MGRRGMWFTVSAAAVLALAGCSGGGGGNVDRTDPVAVSQAFVDAVAAQDSGAACAQMADEDGPIADGDAQACEDQVDGFISEFTEEELEIFGDVEVADAAVNEGGSTAYVQDESYSADTPEDARMPLILNLVDDEWWVDIDVLN
ncbi:hypothetical protein [Beutenbergia cavernae]|nr:hypothetical protein [Beutenbergia cavernae]